jgi:hypothetical protein
MRRQPNTTVHLRGGPQDLVLREAVTARPVRWSGSRSGSRHSRPLRTARAGFLACSSSMEQRILTTRGAHPWLGRPPARYYYRAGSRVDTVVAVAPALVLATRPTYLQHCLTPVGCRFPSVHTRGKSARFPVG